MSFGDRAYSKSVLNEKSTNLPVVGTMEPINSTEKYCWTSSVADPIQNKGCLRQKDSETGDRIRQSEACFILNKAIL